MHTVVGSVMQSMHDIGVQSVIRQSIAAKIVKYLTGRTTNPFVKY